jgi:muconolactone D-isomerase
MLFHVRMTVSLPADLDYAGRAELLDEEQRYCQKLEEAGTLLHRWTVAGHYANISVFDVEDADVLHDIVWNLPLFPFLTVDITPLAARPTAVASGRRA